MKTTRHVSLFVLLSALAFGATTAFASAATINIDNLQPSWTAPGGEGVWSAYYSPDSDTNPAGVSPGSTAIYDGREAGIIKAGITAEPSGPNVGHYMDEGLLGFQVPSVDSPHSLGKCSRMMSRTRREQIQCGYELDW